MHQSKLAKNTFFSLLFRAIAIICGFILPRFILNEFGTQVNGLVNSITQFLGIISFLELGMGAVVQSSLYKPLVDKDYIQISRIASSAERFFKKIAAILCIYVIVLIIIYPYIAKQDFDFGYIALLIVIMSVGSFSEYYFGIVNSLLITADQHGYIQYILQIITLIINTVISCILIYVGASIHIVKLSTAIIYLIRPIILRIYVNKNYNIDRKIRYTEEPIKQKWNGVAQHMSAVVLDGTDNIVLTIFSDLSNVSIYSVYNIVLSGVKQLMLSLTNGIQALLGELWAKKDIESLEKTFSWCEWCLHTITIFIFGCTGVLIVPFISVYTNGITDANYIQPLFAILSQRLMPVTA